MSTQATTTDLDMANRGTKDGPDTSAAQSLTDIPTRPGEEITSVSPAARSEAAVVSDTGVSYIASDTQYPWFAVDRALEQTIDEVERKEGLKVYDRMRDTEPILGGLDKVVKILTLSDGLSVQPNLPKPPRTGATAQQLADYAESQRAAEYVKAVFERLSRIDDPILDYLWNILDGYRLGHKLSEATYDIMPAGEFKGWVCLDSLSCKPRENYAFVVDGMNRFRGVVAKVPGASIVVWQGIIYDVSQLANAIAPEKLVTFAPDKVNKDPRGRAGWRSAWVPFRDKQIRRKQEFGAGTQFAGGKVSAIMPEAKGAVEYTDPITGKKMNLTTAIENVLKNWGNGGYAILPSGTQLTVHANSISPGFFDSGFGRDDREMVTAIVMTPRSILEAKHGSKADGDNAQDLVDELKVWLRGGLCEMMRWKIAFRLLLMSKGQEYAEKYCPIPTMAKASRPDFAANATAVAALQTSGYIDPSQKPEIDSEILALPERDMSADGEEDADDETSAGFQRPGIPFGRRLRSVDEGRSMAAARAKPRP